MSRAAAARRGRDGLAALALLLAACGEAETDYFPLAPGWTWDYRVAISAREIDQRRLRAVVTNLEVRRVDGADVVPRLGHDGSIAYYQAGPDGVRRTGGPELGHAPTATAERYVFKRPLAPGTRWRRPARTYLLRKHVFSTETVPVDLVLEATIEATDAVVSVPAGTFRGCLRVRGVGRTVHELSPLIGEVLVEVEEEAWFAPGVGLVKLVRREIAHPESPGSGVLVMELEALRRPLWPF